MDVTGTFKHRKAELVKDGFDVAAVADPIFIKDDRRATYVPLTSELRAAVLDTSYRI